MNLGFDRSKRQGQLLGNLLVGILLQKAHPNQSSIAGRESLQTVFDLRPLLQANHILLGCRSGRCRRRKTLVDRQLLLATTHVVNKGVAGYRVNPLSKGVIGIVAVETQIDLDEGLLQQVIGIFTRTGSLYKQAQNRIAVAVEEVLEGRVIPFECQLHQRTIFSNDIVGYLHTRRSLRNSSNPRKSDHNGLNRS